MLKVSGSTIRNASSEIARCVKPIPQAEIRVLLAKAQCLDLLLNLAVVHTVLGTRVHPSVPTAVKVQYFPTV